MEKKIDRTCTNNCSDVCGECQIPTKKMENKQTAVSLIAENFNLLSDKDFKSWFLNSLDYLEQLEKQQIVAAHFTGQPFSSTMLHNAEQYYSETYGKD